MLNDVATYSLGTAGTGTVTVNHDLGVTGDLAVTGNLTVTGTSTVVNTVTMNAQNAIVFEGATADANETILTITDPTNDDNTITLPDASGTVALTSSNVASATLAATVTVADSQNTAGTYYPTFVDGATGTQALETDSALTFNASTNVLSSTKFEASSTISTAERILVGKDTPFTGTGVGATNFAANALYNASAYYSNLRYPQMELKDTQYTEARLVVDAASETTGDGIEYYGTGAVYAIETQNNQHRAGLVLSHDEDTNASNQDDDYTWGIGKQFSTAGTGTGLLQIGFVADKRYQDGFLSNDADSVFRADNSYLSLSQTGTVTIPNQLKATKGITLGASSVNEAGGLRYSSNVVQFYNGSSWATLASTASSARTVTAGGNTLGASETLAFTAGTGISISENAGAVTITNSVTDTNTNIDTTDLIAGLGAESGIHVTNDHLAFSDATDNTTKRITLTQLMAAATATMIPTLPADKIGSGSFATARIPTLAQSKVTDLETDLAAKVPATRTIAGRALSNNLAIRVNNSTGKLEINDGSNTTTIQDTAGTPADVIFDNRKTEWAEIQDASSTKPEDGATKNQVFRQSSAPAALSVGDIWVDTDDNKVYSASATGTGDWNLVTAAYTDAEKTKLSGVAANATANAGDVLKTGTINANEFARWSDSTTLEARTAAEVLSDLGIEASADVTDTANVTAAGALMDSEVTNLAFVKGLTSGISNGNVLVANANVADNDFLRVDGTSIEGRTAAEVRSDLGIADDEIIDWASDQTSASKVIHANNYTDTDRYVNSAAFNTGTGVLTLTRAGSDTSTVTVDLDGRYVQTGSSGEANEFSFKTISVSGQTDVVADTTTDTLTLAASGGMTITTSNDTITLSSANTDTTYTAGTNISLSGTTFNVDDAFLKNDANDTTTGTITAGGFTTAGSITLGGHAVDDIDVSSEASDANDHLMTALAIKNRIEDYNYTTNTGTVTSVGTNTGLSGTITGSGNLSLALGDLADMTQSWDNTADEFIVLDGGTQKRKLSSEIFGSNAFNSTTIPTNNNQLTNGAGYITSFTNTVDMGDGFKFRDDDNDDVTITENTYIKFTAATGTAGTNLTGAGTTGDPYIMAITLPNTNTDTNTFRTIEIDTNGNDSANETLGATETLRLKKGSNITLAESGGVVTISSTDTNTVYTHPNHSGDVTSSGDGVTTIGDDKVTYAKMQNVATANRVLGSSSADGAVSEVQVATAMIAADAITGAKIADDSIDSEHYVDGSIDTAHLAADVITGAKIADDAIDSEHITDGSVDNVHLVGSIANSKLVNDGITIGTADTSLGGTVTALVGLTDLDLTADNHTIFDTVGANTLTIGASNTTISIAGDLLVGGTTSTINSTTVTVDDPIFTLGGDTAPSSDDNKDRGIEFRYYDGSAKLGFMGYDDSAGKFTMLTSAANSSEVFTGTKATLVANIEGNVTGNVTGNADTVTTNANLTGDITSSGNATSIASGVIVNADVNASAAIAYSKLNLTGAIVNADLASGVDASKLTAGTLPASRIGAGSITTARLEDDAVTNAKVGADAIDTNELADSAVTGAKVSAFTSDYGQLTATLQSNLGDSGDVVLTSGTSGNLPTRGLLLIENELIYYTGISAHTTTGTVRGYAGTTAAAHTTGNVGTNGVKTPVGVKTTLGGTKDIFIPRFEGAGSSSEGKPGLVPISYAGKTATYLRGDGAWADAGTVGNGNTDLVDGDAVYDYIAAQNFGTGSGDITAVTAGDGLTGGASTGAATLNVVGGTGITANANDIAVTAAQTGITSVLNASLAVGRDAHNQIDFSTDNEIHFKTNNETPVIKMKASGEIEATSLDISGDADIDGTLEADAITIGGTSIAAAGTTSITTLGTIGTGTWQGTAIAGGYIANDAIDSQHYADGSIDNAHIADNAIDSEHYADGSIDTAHIADNQVTLAKMAGITRGSIIIGNASGDPAALAVGSNGQVLTSDGTDISWGSASGGASAIGDLSDAITTATSNIGLGSAALDSLTASSGNYNVAVGVNAGTAITTGDNSVAIGYNALKSTTTQNEATAVGYLAAEDLAGGTFGTSAFGVRSLSNFTTGWGNTGIGHEALYSQEAAGTGSSNTAVGYQAMRGATSSTAISGSQNTAVGGNALEDITSGAANVAVGYQSFTNVTSGSYNIGLGMRTGQNTTTGTRNIAIGDHTFKTNSTGTDMVAIGHNAAEAATAGYSVVIGSLAQETGTGSYNVFLGYRAGYDSDSTQSVALGYGAAEYLDGGNSIAIGLEALKGSSSTHVTGVENVALGFMAGMNVQTGRNNTLIGTRAGDSLTTGDGNVIIGSHTEAASNTGDLQLTIGSHDGSNSVIWITGNSSGGINSKAEVVAVSGNTTLTLAQTGAYIYWTSGTLTLPASGTVGTQYTVINNTGGSATVAVNASNCSMVAGFTSATNATTAISDHELASFVCVTSNTWIQVG